MKKAAIFSILLLLVLQGFAIAQETATIATSDSSKATIAPNLLVPATVNNNTQLTNGIFQSAMVPKPAPKCKRVPVENAVDPASLLKITGLILDKTDKTILTNITVVLVNKDTNIKEELVSDEDGNFVFETNKNYNHLLYATDGKNYSKKYHILTNQVVETKVYNAILEIPRNEKMVDLDYLSDKKTSKDIIYRIEIGRFSKRIPKQSQFIQAIASDLYIDDTTIANTFIYTTGSFNKYSDAEKYLTKLNRLGYQKALIVAYMNGKLVEQNAENVKTFFELKARATAGKK